MSENGLVGRSNVAVWDEHRNTSRVFDVPHTAIDDAERALASLRRTDQKLVAWLEAGAPPIHSEADHVRWFGCRYDDKSTAAPQQERLA